MMTTSEQMQGRLTTDENAFERVQGRLPLTIEAITPEWLTSVLSGYAPGIVVNGVELVTERHGFTTVLRLRVDVNEAGRRAGIGPTLMVKGGFEEHSPSRARTYAMEAIAYRDIWPELELNVPTTYFVDIEPESRQVIILMEDLLARDVVFGDSFKPHTFEQGMAYMGALAALHAKTWESPDIKPGGKWESTSRFSYGESRWEGVANNSAAMLRDYLTTFDYFTPGVWNKFLAMPRCAAISLHLLDLGWAHDALKVCADLMDALPQCIVHGDMHLGNLYWDADGTPGFYDAPPRVEPGLAEVVYYLACCFDPADRRAWEAELLRHYLAELARLGVAEPPSFDEAKRYMAIFLTYGLIVFIINENTYQTESFNTLHCMRYSSAMIDYDSVAIIADALKSGVYLKKG